MKRKSMDVILEKIKAYTKSGSRLPLFVNTNSHDDYLHSKNELSEFLSVKSVSNYCQKVDSLPDMARLFSELRDTHDHVVLLGFSNHLKLIAQRDLQTYLSTIKDLSLLNGKLVVLCFQFQEQLDKLIKLDRRLDTRIFCLQGTTDMNAKVTLINPKIKDILDTNSTYEIGYKKLLQVQEQNCDFAPFAVTSLYNNDFSSTTMTVAKMDGMYEIIDILFGKPAELLPKSFGSDEQWGYLYKKLCEHKTLEGVIEKEFTSVENIASLVFKWKNWDENKQWLFFVGLKVFEPANTYLRIALSTSTSVTNFIKNIYRTLLSYSHTEKLFEKFYDERKELAALIDDLSNVIAYCQMAKIKGDFEIYYLTDNSTCEKQAIIECLSQFDSIDCETEKILQKIYPDLAKYLGQYYFANPELDEYFQQYKRQKVNNKLQPDFLNTVNKKAEERKFNLLPPRNAVFEQIDKDDSVIFLVDALGVEFLGYIVAVCRELGLSLNTSICRANLPTTTYYNKDFLKGFKYRNIKKLDNLKHDGEGDFNYEVNKLPLHIAEELKILRDIFEKVKVEAAKHKKVIIVSDHGASRLVVLNEQQYKFDVKSNGTHGGRCCLYTDDIEIVDYATVENGQYVLASYDRFKGGRAAQVETHGGATLEEVIVPIIEIIGSANDVVVQLVEMIITVSFRRKAVLQLFASKKIGKLVVKINGHFYHASEINGAVYRVPISDIKQPGEYHLEAFDGDNFLSELSFQVEKESSKENKLF
jgi:hypothetical protein